MKNNKLFNGLYIGVVRDLCNTYYEEAKDCKIAYSISIFLFTGRADENGEPM